MWQFLGGVAVGVYVGTMYNCRPAIGRVKEFIKGISSEFKKD
jgi:hypothetical protein